MDRFAKWVRTNLDETDSERVRQGAEVGKLLLETYVASKYSLVLSVLSVPLAWVVPVEDAFGVEPLQVPFVVFVGLLLVSTGWMYCGYIQRPD